MAQDNSKNNMHPVIITYFYLEVYYWDYHIMIASEVLGSNPGRFGCLSSGLCIHSPQRDVQCSL